MCCAAALANLDIWASEPVGERIKALEEMQSVRLKQLNSIAELKNLRQMGTITAMEVATPHADYLADIGPKLYKAFLERGVLLRPLGNTIYVMPPYCSTGEDLDRVYGVIADVVREVV